MGLSVVLTEGSYVLMHAQMRAMQIGATAGLLVAIPGQNFFPETFTQPGAPPIVSAVTVAGKCALVTGALITPLAIYRLATVGYEGITKRAIALRESEGQCRVDTVARVGACSALIFVLLRAYVIARVNEVPLSDVLCESRRVCEAFCFAVSGGTMAVGVDVGTRMAVTKFYQWFDGKGGDGVDLNEMNEISEADAEKVDLVEGVEIAAVSQD